MSQEIISILQMTFALFALTCILITIYFIIKRIKLGILMKMSILLTILGILTQLDMFLIEPNWIKTERVKIHDSQLAEVLEGIKVIQISDLHIQQIGFREEQLMKKINDLKPDILFITGDFFSNRSATAPDAINEYRAVIYLIRSLEVRVGIFGILGNYDAYIRDPDRLKELQTSGIEIVNNGIRMVPLPNKRTLCLANIDDSAGDMAPRYDANGRMRLKKLLEKIPPNSPVILLNHYPGIIVNAFAEGINLVLAGHTHGGQIGIPLLIHMSKHANKSPYMRGLFDTGTTEMYVNRGIGTTDVHARLLCRPEITVFEF